MNTKTLVWMIAAALPIPTALANTSPPAKGSTALEPVVITAASRSEIHKKAISTVQVIAQEQIERSQSSSVTDLLAQYGVGFFSEWTPAQTSINIRGASSDGQGRDFKGQVLVLVNGRRAGTANLSKLSPRDVARIEVVRGPASVIYGSQAIGGVINIITKNGLNSRGGILSIEAGSWQYHLAHAEYAGKNQDGTLYYYLGVNTGKRGNYQSGKGGHKMANTRWDRHGITAAAGWLINEKNLLDLSLRSEGIYNTGFRGSGGNLFSKEDRYNQSADLVWEHGRETDRVHLNAHGYVVKDVDDFKWASPLTAAATSKDHIKRTLEITGIKFNPVIRLAATNELLLGLDAEKSRLRSTRYQLDLQGVPKPVQAAPYDNNHTEKVYGLYFDDTQQLLDGRLILRAGLRHTHGKTSFDHTPNLLRQLTGSANYRKTTWSFGTNFQANEWINLKASAASGFRAPTASELGSEFVSVNGTKYFGNTSLKPESNQQVEIGAIFTTPGMFTDITLFQNIISNRITTKGQKIGSETVYNYLNNPKDIVVRGIEIGNRIAMHEWMKLGGELNWQLQLSGNWNFQMKDKAIIVGPTVNTNKVQRMYKYQASLTNTFANNSGPYPWNIQLQGILRGPMWYDTEERLIAGAEPYRTYRHRKSAFWIWNLRGEMEMTKQLRVFARVDNLLNKNEHPIFIALDKKPYILDKAASNGDLGTSMPGRALTLGLRYTF